MDNIIPKKFFFKLFIIVLVSQASYATFQLSDIPDLCPASGTFITQDFNATWERARGAITPETPLFVPLSSKYSAIVLTQYLYQTYDFKLLTESQLVNSCLTGYQINGWLTLNLTMYNLSREAYLYPTDNPHVLRGHYPMPVGAISGIGSIALTDNENYVVYDYCFDNGLRSFSVISRDPVLSKTQVAVITAHMKSLGFKEKDFIHYNVMECLDENGKMKPKKDSKESPFPIPDYSSNLAFSPHRFLTYVSTFDLTYPVNIYMKK